MLSLGAKISAITLFGCQLLFLNPIVLGHKLKVDMTLDMLDNYIDDSYENLKQANPDDYLTAPELIQKYGYTAETHEVTTKDGYILTLHRIPYGKNSSNPKKKRPVALIQHGIFSSSADWLLNCVDKALPYMAADAGYDVWLGNARGNVYSMKHVSLSPADRKFWDFTFHEMGVYDLPSVIDYVLNVTGQPDLYYIGHSMGTTMFFVCMSSLPEYNQKIKFMAAMGPAVYLNHMKGTARYLAPLAYEEKIILDLLGHGAMLPEYMIKYLNKYAPGFCTEEMRIEDLCENIFFVLAGFDPLQANKTELPVILAHTPTTSSTKTLAHFFQGVRSGKFRQYDYGYLKNKYIYGSWSPPKYDLSKVKIPVALFHAPNDILVVPEDVQRLSGDLPGLVGNFAVNYSSFNHIDFLFAIDVDVLVNKPLLGLLAKY